MILSAGAALISLGSYRHAYVHDNQYVISRVNNLGEESIQRRIAL